MMQNRKQHGAGLKRTCAVLYFGSMKNYHNEKIMLSRMIVLQMELCYTKGVEKGRMRT